MCEIALGLPEVWSAASSTNRPRLAMASRMRRAMPSGEELSFGESKFKSFLGAAGLATLRRQALQVGHYSVFLSGVSRRLTSPGVLNFPSPPSPSPCHIAEDPTAKAELGTVSFAIAPHHLASYRPLPAWLEQGTESSLRDTEEEKGLPPTLAVTSLSSAMASQLGSSGGFDGFGSGNSSPALAGAAIPTNTARKGFVDLDRFYDSDNEE